MNTQTAIVIGGTSGIGDSVATALADRGIQTIRKGRSNGLDITDMAAIQALFASFDSIDHVVVTAGSQAPGGVFAGLDLMQAKQAFNTKFWGSLAVVQAALPRMNVGGTITLTSGFLARKVVPGTFVKTAMNAALEASIKLIAKESAPVRVNVVSPGLTDTPAYKGMQEDARSQMFMNASKALPAGRVARAQDVAAAYLFAIDNPSVTGSIIDVDGGALVN